LEGGETEYYWVKLEGNWQVEDVEIGIKAGRDEYTGYYIKGPSCTPSPSLTVEVSGLSDLTLTQADIATGNQYGSLGTLSVSITASVSYTASVYYTYTIVTGSTSPFTGDPLSLQADSGTWYTIPGYPSSITLPDFSGSPGTESHDYPVRVDLSLLGDRDAGDVIQFTVHVTVSASSP